MELIKLENELRNIWNKVWNDQSPKCYAKFRLFKTEDKINTLMKLGVDFHGKRVLDIGCGEGTALFYLQKKFNVTGVGIDISDEVVKRNEAKVVDNDGLEFYVGNHKSLEYPSNEFDIVLSWGVVEHFKEYIQALAEARRVLRKDGTLILIQPNSWSFGVWQEKILRLRGKWRFGDQKNFSYRYLRKILIALGYYDLSIITKPPYRDMAITRFFDRIMKRLVKHWGHYLYIVARKKDHELDYQQSFELFLSHTDEKKVIREILEQKVDMHAVKSCLDIGGGNGFLTQSLGDKNKILVVEPNRNFVETLREKGFRCICAKWENVNLEERFDLILGAYVSTYFPKSRLEEMISKMRHHLTIDGRLVLLAVDEKEGSWREVHTHFYHLIGIRRQSSTATLKKIMLDLGVQGEKIVTKVYADSVDQMLQILAFDFCKYGSQFEQNKDKLKDYLQQFQKGDKIELEMVHWMFIAKK